MSMHPPRDPDELASDLVDGLLPEDEAARLRNDPAIAARVAAIEAGRAALRVPPPSAPGAADRAIAATFAALDRATLPMAGAAGAPPPPVSDERPPPPVVPLRTVGPPAGEPWAPAHSSRRSGRSRRPSQMGWLAAAAAIVLLGLVTVGILSTGSDSGDQSSSDVAASAPSGHDAEGGGSADQATEEGHASAGDESGASTTGDAPAAATESDDGDGGADDNRGAGATTAPHDVPTADRQDLGTVDSPAELADRIRSRTGLGPASGEGVLDGQTESSESSGGGDGSSGCAGRTAAGDPARGDSVYAADAVYAGEPVRVHVYDDGNGNLRLVATNAACVDVVDTAFSG